MTEPNIIAILVAYLLGSLPFGYVLVRLRHDKDVRGVGSGSTGATNVTRAAGPLVGAAVLILDVVKGYGAVWLADWLTVSDDRIVPTAAVAAILGHSFPVFLQFRGGKSVATGVGVFVYLQPWAVPAVLIIWLVAMAIWRYVSLASILAAAALPLVSLQLYRPPAAILLALVAGSTIIISRHRSNIERLIAGKENRFRFRRRA